MTSRNGWEGRKIWLVVFAILLVAAEGVEAKSKPAPRPGSTRSAPKLEALPLVRSRQNHLIVRAFINNKPALLMVDTGSPGTIIASRRRQHFQLTGASPDLNLPKQILVNGVFNNIAIARSVRLGALNIIDVPVVVTDLGGSRHASRLLHEQEVDGILGADVLFATRAILDCQQKVLIMNIEEGTGNIPASEMSEFRSMPMFVSEGLNSYVNSSVNGTPGRLLVDTGAFATILDRSFIRQIKIPMHQTGLVSASINLKESGVHVARIRRLTVGSVDFAGQLVGVSDLKGLLRPQAGESAPPVVGLLGGEILSRYHGVIDFGRRTLYLKR